MQAPSSVDPSLLSCFYEGISNPHRLGEGLQRIGELLDCDRVLLRIWDRRGYWGCRSEAVRRGDQWARELSDSELPESALRTLLRRFEPGQWKLLEQLHPQPQGAGGVRPASCSDGEVALCTRLPLPQAEALLALYRHARGWEDIPSMLGHANDACRALLPALDPISRLRSLGRQAATLSGILNSFRMPMLLLDASQRPLAGNAAAASLFRFSSRSAGGKITASVPGVPGSQLAQLVRQAIGKPAAGGAIPLPGRAGEPTAHLLVLPLALPGIGATQQAALVLAEGMTGMPEQAELLLQSLYRLTPAEARLTQLILDGQSPGDAASLLQVSVSTVRTQLSAVLKKTGAQRQADLVRSLSPLLVFRLVTGTC